MEVGMGFLDKVKTNLQDTAQMAREGLEELQTKRELTRAYGDFGRKAFELLESGELSHAQLQAGAEEIRKLKAELEAEQAAGSRSSEEGSRPRRSGPRGERALLGHGKEHPQQAWLVERVLPVVRAEHGAEPRVRADVELDAFDHLAHLGPRERLCLRTRQRPDGLRSLEPDRLREVERVRH